MALILGVAATTTAQAAPVTYNLLSGTLDTVQLQGVGSPCVIGSGNCLVNPPLAITSASITLDTDTKQLLNLTIFVPGPGTLDLDGFNGYEQIVFSNTTFQSSLPTALSGSDPLFSFASPGIASVSQLTLFPTGGGSVGPIPYSPSTTPTGTIQLDDSTGQLTLNLQGVDLGYFVDPITGGNPTLVKADFSLTAAAVPEPGAALLYSVGMLIAAGSLKRRARAA